ncbi:putative bifunctional diguanylate cyclase/phosphodiesterase [Shinella daejeonensis]|uniref:putative bifunctional diguanylate cyclase/phosphodiesterase n=1 Tax=Shinella daejeonensis TaxID=659017 RepID=UPI0020C81F99|nr:EAL domain-containing protein [Shinella daejeonensis]
MITTVRGYMMSIASSPKVARRYALAGVVFGTILPAAYFAVEAVAGVPAGERLSGLSLPVAVLLGLTPVLFGLGFYGIGRSRARLLAELVRQRRIEDRLRHQAWHDRLTGLWNRLRLELDVESVAVAGDERPALLLLDLDRFKHVNDSLGHDAGDALLAAIARRLQRNFADDARVYRFGGDEFVLIVPGFPSQTRVADLCRRVCALFGDPFELGGNRVASGCSIGATFLAPSDRRVADLLKRADLALYRAKERSGNSFRLFDTELAAELSGRLEIERDLEQALRDDAFFLLYQPIVGTESGSVRGFEALLRWAHPTRGVLPPDLFLPVAQRTGLAIPLGRQVIREACREAARWPGPTGVAVNISATQILADGFSDHVLTSLEDAGLAPGRLTLEVREQAFAEDREAVCERLEVLRRRGICIALDDFGVGPSAINALRSLPVDQLKIGQALVAAAAESGEAAELIGVIVRMGKALGLPTVAQGIETPDQLAFIRDCGASALQGSLVSPPVAAEAVTGFLSRPPERRSA